MYMIKFKISKAEHPLLKIIEMCECNIQMNVIHNSLPCLVSG